MSFDDLDVPRAIKNYWRYENENDDVMSNLYFDNVVIEVLNEEYLRDWDYYLQERDKILMAKFPLVFELVHLTL